MSTTESPRQRLARLMDERRAELDKTWAEVADDAGLTREGLRRLRDGVGRTIRSQSKAGIERALLWRHGSVNAVLSGGEPMPVLPYSADTRGKIRDLRAQIDALREQMGEQIGDRNRVAWESAIEVLGRVVEESTPTEPHG